MFILKFSDHHQRPCFGSKEQMNHSLVLIHHENHSIVLSRYINCRERNYTWFYLLCFHYLKCLRQFHKMAEMFCLWIYERVEHSLQESLWKHFIFISFQDMNFKHPMAKGTIMVCSKSSFKNAERYFSESASELDVLRLSPNRHSFDSFQCSLIAVTSTSCNFRSVFFQNPLSVFQLLYTIFP